MSTGEHEYFTVEPTACTVPKRGALAIYCGDAPRRIEGGTSFSLRAPLLLIPQDMFADEADIASKVARVLNENSHLFFSSAKPQPQPAGKDDGDGWGWYAGSDGEYYPHGPFDSREHAVAALYGEAGYIVEARQDPIRVADWIGADDVLERADDYLADSEFGHIDGDPLFEATPEHQRDLEERLKRACDDWQAAHGLVFKPWAFTASRNSERIEALIAERDAARDAALEEAAKVAEGMADTEANMNKVWRNGCQDAAAAIRALPAAPTFTAADLERAWKMGRDAVLADVQELRDAPSIPPGNERAEVYNEACDNILRFAVGLSPPADLAERVKE